MYSAMRSPRILRMIVVLGLHGLRPGLFGGRVFLRRGRRQPFAGGPGQGQGKLQKEVRRCQEQTKDRKNAALKSLIPQSSGGTPP